MNIDRFKNVYETIIGLANDKNILDVDIIKIEETDEAILINMKYKFVPTIDKINISFDINKE